MRRTAALILGGGPAGSAAAITLARGGLVPHLVERTTRPHDVVCGGFLGWDALDALATLRIDVRALKAHPIHRLRLIAARSQVEVDLPHPAVGLSRRTLDEALLNAARKSGVLVSRGRVARALEADRRVRFDDGEEFAPDALFLATGKHELRGGARPLQDRAEPPSIGLRASLHASPALDVALEGIIELHFFNGGYAGLLLQEDGTANLAISAARARLSDAGGARALVNEITREAPRLAERISDHHPDAWTAIAGVPYGWRTAETQPGVFRLGDQSAVISSLAGDGVAIALRSGIAAGLALLAHGPAGAEAYQRGFSARARRPLAVAEALRWAAERQGPRIALMGLARVRGLTRLAARLTRIG
ncbi:MAG TPA: FAD-dependent monooxygenase [Sphingomonadaceae bacterium]|nr:FAD-dependent monooxygenase [Sphingomonadaceae bacterium]